MSLPSERYRIWRLLSQGGGTWPEGNAININYLRPLRNFRTKRGKRCCKDVALKWRIECFGLDTCEKREGTTFGAGRLRATRYHKNCDNVAGSTRRGVSSPFRGFRGLAVQTTRGRKPSFFCPEELRLCRAIGICRVSPLSVPAVPLFSGSWMGGPRLFQKRWDHRLSPIVSSRSWKRLDRAVPAQICALTPSFFYRKIKETDGRRKTAGE